MVYIIFIILAILETYCTTVGFELKDGVYYFHNSGYIRNILYTVGFELKDGVYYFHNSGYIRNILYTVGFELKDGVYYFLILAILETYCTL